MAALQLTLSCWDYDRTRALADGSVRPEGIELIYLPLSVEETFFRMMRSREFHCAEMSLSSYVASLGAGEAPFVAIPAFPSRCFRHSGIFVSAKSGITRPEQLAGKRIGVPEYQLTAPVWMRGMLADEYRVPVESATYWTGGQEDPGRIEKLKVSLPAAIRVESIPGDRTLSQMLAEGEIDALHSPRVPSTYYTRPGTVRRLFENYVETEKEYYRRTRIFPIMHTVVIRRDLYRQHPWVAQSLYKAFLAAQKKAYEGYAQTAAWMAMLPWLPAHVEEARRVMGEDWWPYGLEANRVVLDTFLRYHHEQGLSKRRFGAQELFAPETLEAFKV
ncbi:MAG: ABC transporter substrate-binding protein [Burkholderiales bacterium]|nr:ABC transporter substrate-binding protein [Burkholderiales bacterium]